VSTKPDQPCPEGQGADPTPDLTQAPLCHSGDAVVLLDAAGAVDVWDHGCEALLGWSGPEVLGRPSDILVQEDQREAWARALRTVVNGTASPAWDTWFRSKCGQAVPVSCWLSPLQDLVAGRRWLLLVVRDRRPELASSLQLERAQRLAEARFGRSVVAQAVLAPDLTVIDVNPALCRLSGYDTAQLIGRSLLELVRADADPGAAVEDVERGAEALRVAERQRCVLMHADGSALQTRLSLVEVRDASHQLVSLEAVVEDVSMAAVAQRELQLGQARWQSLETHSTDVALFSDRDGRLLFVSGSVTVRFGYAPGELVGAVGFSLVHPEDEPAVRAIWTAAVAAQRGATHFFDARVRHADGSWRWVEMSLTNALADPAIGAMVVNVIDVSERKMAEAVLQELVGKDPLTGLATRAPLMAALDAVFQDGAAGSTAVAVVDVSGLTLINDAYGHRVGDGVLVAVAQRLAQAREGQGLVARVGGDRFALLLSKMAGAGQVAQVCAGLLGVIQEPLDLDGCRLVVSASVGAAMGPAADGGGLLSSAEAALSAAKEGVPGACHVVQAEPASAAVTRARLIDDLRRGMDNNELLVHFQPVLRLADGQPVAAEALVRWRHPGQGLLGPDAFIGAAEDSGLIVGLGRIVLREACLAAARWAHVLVDGTFQVAVNLSARQLTDGDVVEVVRQALQESGAAPQNLMLEVTESAVMSDVAAAVQALQELRELGLAIAVDDFGTGYSSLTYLKQFPVTTLKIDRSFVSGLGHNRDDAAIVTSVINLAGAMGLDCIAEGVETEQQRLVLQALGCGYGQGFLWTPGLDVAAFDRWLRTRKVLPQAPGARAVRAAGRPLAAARQLPVLPVLPAVHARIANLLATGASLTTIAAALNADHQPTAGGRRWTATSVANLLAEPPR
jgi:diguanylate cyclase (GGDEF)-like protein/PAS domain S-box-containing protein